MIDGLVVVNSGTVSSRRHYTLYGNSFNVLTFYEDGGLLVEEHRLTENRNVELATYRLPRWTRLPH
jgi:hypothetical protein